MMIKVLFLIFIMFFNEKSESESFTFIDLDHDHKSDMFINFCKKDVGFCNIIIITKNGIYNFDIPSANFIGVEVHACSIIKELNCIYVSYFLRNWYYETEYMYSREYNTWLAIKSSSELEGKWEVEIINKDNTWSIDGKYLGSK